MGEASCTHWVCPDFFTPLLRGFRYHSGAVVSRGAEPVDLRSKS
jgi:hypothetical protein